MWRKICIKYTQLLVKETLKSCVQVVPTQREVGTERQFQTTLQTLWPGVIVFGGSRLQLHSVRQKPVSRIENRKATEKGNRTQTNLSKI